MSPVGAISVSPAVCQTSSIQRLSVPLPYSAMPLRGIACLPIAPSRHGLSVRVFALASLSPSAHSHRSASPRGSELCYRVAIPLLSRPCIALCSTDHCQLLCQTHHIVADCCVKLIRSLPIKALPSQCFSNQCRAPCLTNQCQALAQPCRAPRHNAFTSLHLAVLHAAPAVRVSAVRPPCPNRAGLCSSFPCPGRAHRRRPDQGCTVTVLSKSRGCAVPPPFLSTQFNALSGPTISMPCRRPC